MKLSVSEVGVLFFLLQTVRVGPLECRERVITTPPDTSWEFPTGGERRFRARVAKQSS